MKYARLPASGPASAPLGLAHPVRAKRDCDGRPAALSKYKNHPSLIGFLIPSIFPFDLKLSPFLFYCACLLPADLYRSLYLDPAQVTSLTRWSFSLSCPYPSSCWLPRRIQGLSYRTIPLSIASLCLTTAVAVQIKQR